MDHPILCAPVRARLLASLLNLERGACDSESWPISEKVVLLLSSLLFFNTSSSFLRRHSLALHGPRDFCPPSLTRSSLWQLFFPAPRPPPPTTLIKMKSETGRKAPIRYHSNQRCPARRRDLHDSDTKWWSWEVSILENGRYSIFGCGGFIFCLQRCD